MSNSMVVRLARAEDKSAVLAFCQNTFTWGDYIAEVWDNWVKQEHGCLLVALVDDQPAGIVHAAFLDEKIVWMEGMRVNPAFRRQGIATELNERALAFAREQKRTLARLVTSVKNTSAQTMLQASHYERAVRFNEWHAEPQAGDFSIWRVASERDAETILKMWHASPMFATSRGVLPNRYWRWVALDEKRLREQIRLHEVRLAANSFALLPAFDDSDWNGLSLHGIAGNREQIRALALAARAEAAHRGYAHVEAILPDDANTNETMTHAGFTTEGGTFLYEQTL